MPSQPTLKGTSPSGSRKPQISSNRLWVQDTGVGFPKDLDYRNLNSLGLQLVINLSEHQLGGTLTMENTNGTTMTVMFPI